MVLQKTEHAVTIACNCPYFGECKHEAAVLQYLEKHPVLKIVNRPITMEFSHLDDLRSRLRNNSMNWMKIMRIYRMRKDCIYSIRQFNMKEMFEYHLMYGW